MMNEILHASSPYGSYSPRSSYRPSSIENDCPLDFEMDGFDDDICNDTKNNTSNSCIVNGCYNLSCPRLPLKRQKAQTFPRIYYNSLAMVLPLQYIHIEKELCRFATIGNNELINAIERIYDDYCYRNIFNTLSKASSFLEKFECTVQYLIQMGRLSMEDANKALQCVDQVLASRTSAL